MTAERGNPAPQTHLHGLTEVLDLCIDEQRESIPTAHGPQNSHYLYLKAAHRAELERLQQARRLIAEATPPPDKVKQVQAIALRGLLKVTPQRIDDSSRPKYTWLDKIASTFSWH